MAMLNEKMRKIFSETGAEALFVEQDFLRRYLTGFYSTDGYVVLDGESCRFVADPRYFEAAEKALRGTATKAAEGGRAEALALLGGKKRLGVPFPFLSLSNAKRLEDEGFELVDCMPALRAAMTVKTPEEIGYIQTACDIAEAALNSILPELSEGMEERETAALLEYRMRQLGASGTSFETIVAYGANASVPHHETGGTKLKFGDAVLIDFGCKVGGYCSDCTRTFLFGDDGKHGEFKTAYAEVLKAHELVKEKLVSGMTGREADEIARGSLRRAGLDRYFTHSLGHGVGLQIHEYPVLSPRGDEILQDGMVFSDEPGVYLAGEYGIRIEDTVTLKDGKVASFMKKTERNLIIL